MSPNGFYHQTQNDFADFVGAERIEEGALFRIGDKDGEQAVILKVSDIDEVIKGLTAIRDGHRLSAPMREVG